MKAEEKAEELLLKYSILNEGHNHLVRQCAIIAVDEIRESLEQFGYSGTFYDDYETGQMTLTEDKDPSVYWQEVKQHLTK